jgi:hypothetical protein
VLCHEIIENRLCGPELGQSIIIVKLHVFFLIFGAPLLQKYAAQNPIFQWHRNRALQKIRQRLSI